MVDANELETLKGGRERNLRQGGSDEGKRGSGGDKRLHLESSVVASMGSLILGTPVIGAKPEVIERLKENND